MRGTDAGKIRATRRLRRDATEAERRLWYRLRARSLIGMKFVRQELIRPYIVDFACREHRVIVEVDGGQYADSQSDAVPDQWLRDNGYRVLRFWNNDVLANTEGVLATIAEAGDVASSRYPGSPGEQGAASSPLPNLAQAAHAASSPSPRLRGEGRDGVPKMLCILGCRGEGPDSPARSGR